MEPEIKKERDEEDKEFLEQSLNYFASLYDDDPVTYELSDLKEIFNQE